MDLEDNSIYCPKVVFIQKGKRMIPSNLRIVLICALLVYFAIVLIFLKNKTLELRYTLLWLAAGGVLTVLVAWPQLLTICVALVGIQSNMNGLFIMAFAFVIMIMMSLTAIVSKQTNRIKILVQEMAIMDKKIRELQEMKGKEKERE